MKSLIILTIILGSVALQPQSYSGSGTGRTPKDVVGLLWLTATEGQLLSQEGWNHASALFTERSAWPGLKKIRVVSNLWGIVYSSTKGNAAEVDVDYGEAGTIDASLRYAPPPKTPHYKTFLRFNLVFEPTHGFVYKTDGKTIEREITGPTEWQIKEPPGVPWTTVNSAIRYVLEKRETNEDPVIRSNADQTLRQLLKLR